MRWISRCSRSRAAKILAPIGQAFAEALVGVEEIETETLETGASNTR
jgi:hypothetical protein